jgi:hypothetical protein
MQTLAQKEAMKKYRASQKYKDTQKEYRKIRSRNPIIHEKIKSQKRESHKRCILHNLLTRTKARASKKELEFNLTQDDITIPSICPILEIPIFVGNKKDYRNSPTIDRLDNSKGYTKENCRVISMLANTMKNSASKEEIEAFCRNIFNYLKVD